MIEITSENVRDIMCHYGEAFCDIVGCDSSWLVRFEAHFAKNSPVTYASWRKEYDEYVDGFENPSWVNDHSRAGHFDCNLLEHLNSNERYYQVVADFANTDRPAALNISSLLDNVDRDYVENKLWELHEEIRYQSKFAGGEDFDYDYLITTLQRAKSVDGELKNWEVINVRG